MARKLTKIAMECVHLDYRKIGVSEYFQKRGFDTLLAQPKLNGIRALWDPVTKTLRTRNNLEINSVPHINRELYIKYPHVPFDGELFSWDIHFNDINGAVRSKHPTEISERLEYHIFDVKTYSRQTNRLPKVDEFYYNDFIIPVETIIMKSSLWKDYLSHFLNEGYEGAVFRNPSAPYDVGRHVGYIWAIKPEYEIEGTFVDFMESTTDLHSDTFGSILLEHTNRRTYSCSGIDEDTRKKLYRELKPRMQVTVRFGAWSSDDPRTCVPLFPRFKCVRWDK